MKDNSSLYSFAVHQVMAKYQNKKTVKTQEGKDMTVYEYGPRQIANRHKEKADRLENLKGNIAKLDAQVKKDMKASDIQTRLTALAVALIQNTYERVGNEGSAESGHYGVTGWLKEHLSFKGSKAILSYVGKSGVKQTKEVSEAPLVASLKELSKGKKSSDPLFVCPDCTITSKEVNTYLKPFDITAKDLRGYGANCEMREVLTTIRKDGPQLPHSRKEKDEILKQEFKEALEKTADIVGHTTSILRSSYLSPNLEEAYMHDGTIPESMKKESTLKTASDRLGLYVQATKTDLEKEEDYVEDRAVRKEPKKKPPRKDLREFRIEDKDPDTEMPSASNDRDLSLNYKKVGLDMWTMAREGKAPPPKPPKGTAPITPSAIQAPGAVPAAPGGKAPVTPKTPPSQPSHRPGDVWQTSRGSWGGMNAEGLAKYFKNRETATAFAKGAEQPAKQEQPVEQIKPPMESTRKVKTPQSGEVPNVPEPKEITPAPPAGKAPVPPNMGAPSEYGVAQTDPDKKPVLTKPQRRAPGELFESSWGGFAVQDLEGHPNYFVDKEDAEKFLATIQDKLPNAIQEKRNTLLETLHKDMQKDENTSSVSAGIQKLYTFYKENPQLAEDFSRFESSLDTFERTRKQFQDAARNLENAHSAQGREKAQQVFLEAKKEYQKSFAGVAEHVSAPEQPAAEQPKPEQPAASPQKKHSQLLSSLHKSMQAASSADISRGLQDIRKFYSENPQLAEDSKLFEKSLAEFDKTRKSFLEAMRAQGFATTSADKKQAEKKLLEAENAYNKSMASFSEHANTVSTRKEETKTPKEETDIPNEPISQVETPEGPQKEPTSKKAPSEAKETPEDSSFVNSAKIPKALLARFGEQGITKEDTEAAQEALKSMQKSQPDYSAIQGMIQDISKSSDWDANQKATLLAAHAYQQQVLLSPNHLKSATPQEAYKKLASYSNEHAQEVLSRIGSSDLEASEQRQLGSAAMVKLLAAKQDVSQASKELGIEVPGRMAALIQTVPNNSVGEMAGVLVEPTYTSSTRQPIYQALHRMSVQDLKGYTKDLDSNIHTAWSNYGEAVASKALTPEAALLAKDILTNLTMIVDAFGGDTLEKSAKSISPKKKEKEKEKETETSSESQGSFDLNAELKRATQTDKNCLSAQKNFERACKTGDAKAMQESGNAWYLAQADAYVKAYEQSGHTGDTPESVRLMRLAVTKKDPSFILGTVKKETPAEDAPNAFIAAKQPGTTWTTFSGFGAKTPEGKVDYFDDKEAAEAFAKGDSNKGSPKLAAQIDYLGYSWTQLGEGGSLRPIVSYPQVRISMENASQDRGSNRRETMSKLTKKGAREVTATLDRIANLFQTEAATLGVDARIASDFAYRCDLLSDHLEKTAAADALGQDLNSNQEYDPSDIGREVAGPLEQLDSDEPWMKGQFTQQQFRDLHEMQQSGKMGPLNPEPAAPQPGKQASKQAALTRLAALEAELRAVKAEMEEKKVEEAPAEKQEKTASVHGYNLTAE